MSNINYEIYEIKNLKKKKTESELSSYLKESKFFNNKLDGINFESIKIIDNGKYNNAILFVNLNSGIEKLNGMTLKKNSKT